MAAASTFLICQLVPAIFICHRKILVQRSLYVKTTIGTNKIRSLYTVGLFVCKFNNVESIPLKTCKTWSLYTSGL